MAWDREMSAEDPSPPTPLWVQVEYQETMSTRPSAGRGCGGGHKRGHSQPTRRKEAPFLEVGVLALSRFPHPLPV